jgi:hypothetical protein
LSGSEPTTGAEQAIGGCDHHYNKAIGLTRSYGFGVPRGPASIVYPQRYWWRIARADWVHPNGASKSCALGHDHALSQRPLLLALGPGGVLVVSGAGFETAVQDADEAVGELAECCLVADVAIA